MKQKKCLDCGNNQTNHTLSWINNTAAIATEFLDPILVNNTFGKLIGRIIARATGPYLEILRVFRLISWNDDMTKASTDRARVIWAEATDRGIPMKQLVIFNKPVEFYRATLPGGKTIFFESIPATQKKFVASAAWMDDKSALKKKLAKKNIPVPHGKSVYTWKQAERLWEILKHPLIVKPRLGSRGRHTTTFLYSKEDLKRAYRSAKKLSFFVMIEEHIVGSVYRGTCVNGQLLGVLEGMPPRVTGNGIDTIGGLIGKKNNEVFGTAVKPVILSEQLETFLKRTGHTLESIIPAGTTIDLSEKIGLSYGGDSRELFYETHPKVKQYLEQAAQVVDGGVIGFDFITSDPTIDPDGVHWGIIECNSLPFINLHHHPHIGTPVNIAAAVWDEVLKNHNK